MRDAKQPQEPRLLTVDEVAGLLRVSVPTLARWRFEGAGPDFIKLGPGKRAPVRYRASDVDAFVERNKRSNTVES